MDTRGDNGASGAGSQPPRAATPSADDADGASSVLGANERTRCGEVLRARRIELGFENLREAADAIGIGHSSLGVYEAGGRAPRPRAALLIDRAYGYIEGSVSSLYRTGQRPVLNKPAPAPPPAMPTTDFPITLSVSDLIELGNADRDLGEFASASADPELTEIRHRLGRLTDRIFRNYVIAQVEGRRAAGVEDDPFVSTLLATQLARGPVADDDQDNDELNYLKWLLGQSPHLTDKAQARYAKRLETRMHGRQIADTHNETRPPV